MDTFLKLANFLFNSLIINLSTSHQVSRNINIFIAKVSVILPIHIIKCFKMKYSTLKTSVLFYLLLPFTAWAQTPPPPPAGAPPGFPISGIIYALLAAVSYGIYKHVKNPKK
jgi:hypothetical protein